MNDGTATDRASELGAAHGKAAAEAWLEAHSVGWAVQARLIARNGLEVARGFLPEPDLSGEEVDRIYGDVTVELPVYMATCEAYEAAFTAAVETTVRSASDSDQATVREAVQS